jgi:hypothetical protein
MKTWPYTLDEIDPNELYNVSSLRNLRVHRGRKLDEALRNDPLAPRPTKDDGHSRLYLGSDLIAYADGSGLDFSKGEGVFSDQERRALANIAAAERASMARLDDHYRKLAEDREKLRQRMDDERAQWCRQTIEELRAEVFEKLASTKLRWTSINTGGLRVSGVYFLKQKGEIVYVGQSVCMAARVSNHLMEGRKEFDEAMFFRCEKAELDNWEGFFIRLLRPRLNDGSHLQVVPAPSSKLWQRIELWAPETVTA